MIIKASGPIQMGDVSVEIGQPIAFSTSLGFLNNLIIPSQRPSNPHLGAFYGLSYFQSNKDGNCNNGNCASNCNCGNIQCNNCTIAGNVNCANCDTQAWLQTGANCACTYNCNTAQTTYNCNCACNCSKIICANLYEKGLMDRQIWAADQEYGRLLRKRDKPIYRGYIRWARIITAWMDGKGPDFLFWIHESRRKEAQKSAMILMAQKIGDPWSKHMAFLMGVEKEDNFMGRVLMNIGVGICKFVDLIPRKPKFKRKHGVFTVATIWACLYFSYYTAVVCDRLLNPKVLNKENLIEEGRS